MQVSCVVYTFDSVLKIPENREAPENERGKWWKWKKNIKWIWRKKGHVALLPLLVPQKIPPGIPNFFSLARTLESPFAHPFTFISFSLSVSLALSSYLARFFLSPSMGRCSVGSCHVGSHHTRVSAVFACELSASATREIFIQNGVEISTLRLFCRKPFSRIAFL